MPSYDRREVRLILFAEQAPTHETARKERTKLVLLNSRKQGEIYQSDDPTTMRGSTAGELRLGLFDYNVKTVAV